MGIQCEDYSGERIDPATLPPFRNDSCCAACGSRGPVRVHYAPASATINGPHFKRICGCGNVWYERAASGGGA